MEIGSSIVRYALVPCLPPQLSSKYYVSALDAEVSTSQENEQKEKNAASAKVKVHEISSNLNEYLRVIWQNIQTSKSTHSITLCFQIAEMHDFIIQNVLTALFTSSPRLCSLSLNLTSSDWGDSHIRLFSTTLGEMHELREINLNLKNNFMTDNGFSYLETTLMHNLHQLSKVTLVLDGNPLVHRGLSVLRILNLDQRHIKVLKLSIKDIPQAFDQQLAAILKDFKTTDGLRNLLVFHVSLGRRIPTFHCIDQKSKNKILDDHYYQPEQPLQQLHPLRSAPIQKSLSTYFVPPHLSKQLENNPIPKQSSVYSSDYPSAENAAQGICLLLKIMLKFTANLRDFSLDCSGKFFSDLVWRKFGDLLKAKSHQGLEVFSLSVDNTTYAAQTEIDYFLFRLGAVSSLQQLLLRFPGQSQSTYVTQLSRFLAVCPSTAVQTQQPLLALSRLTLDFSWCGRLSAATISDVSELLTKLQVNLTEINLDFSHSSFSDANALSLAHALKQCKILSNLQLNLNECSQVTDTTIRYLASAIEKAESKLNVIHLNFKDTMIASNDCIHSLLVSLNTHNDYITSLVFNCAQKVGKLPQLAYSSIIRKSIIECLLQLRCLLNCQISLPNKYYDSLLRIAELQAKDRAMLLTQCHLVKKQVLHSTSKIQLKNELLCEVLAFGAQLG